MADMQEGELELELEEEFHEGELEDEAGLEGEGWLGAIGNVASSLLGEEELEDEASLGEFEDESEDEFEDEYEGEGLLGEDEFEDEFEDEGEYFSFGGFLKKALPVLKSVARVAAPAIGGALLGPAGAALGKAAGSALGEEEFEDESEFEGEAEMVHEIAAHPVSHNEALAEMMADAASRATHEGEAEALAGAAAVTVISPRDRRILRRSLPSLLSATAALTRILLKRPRGKAGIKLVPTVMRRTVKSLKRQAAKGRPITRARLARTTAKQVKRVLGSPKAAAAGIVRNTKVSRGYRRSRRRTRTRLHSRRRAAI